MKRVIKFRGKTLYDFIEKVSGEYEIPQGTFVYGSLVFDCNKNPLIDIQGYNNGIGFKSQYLVDANTVGQFTGLHDKHDVKIFEGDIVRVYDFSSVYASEYKGVVKMVHGTWIVEYDSTFGTSRPKLFFDDFADRKTEVIGNIYDNPELAKGGKYGD